MTCRVWFLGFSRSRNEPELQSSHGRRVMASAWPPCTSREVGGTCWCPGARGARCRSQGARPGSTQCHSMAYQWFALPPRLVIGSRWVAYRSYSAQLNRHIDSKVNNTRTTATARKARAGSIRPARGHN